MNDAVLAAYVRRTGLDAPLAPTLDTLAAVQRLHSRAIPFENLDPWLGRPVRLDPPSLHRKLLQDGRGGWCFEHNLLLAEVLADMGFQVTPLAARVLWNQPEDAVRPRTHMLLRVDVDGQPWLVDGGFGGNTPTAPLLLHETGAQATPHEPYRVVPVSTPHGPAHQTEVHAGGEWRLLYRYDQQPQVRADAEVTSWYLCHHPESHFRQRLIAARTRDDGRDTLLENAWTRRWPDGRSEVTVLATAAELCDALEQVFGLRLPDDPTLPRRLAQVAAEGSSPLA